MPRRNRIELVDVRGTTYPENLGRQVSNVTSINELELDLLLRRYWPNSSADVLREGVNRTAPIVAREARKSTLFRDRTGALRKSIRVQRRKTDAGIFVNVVAGGPRAPHAHFLEFGTKDRYTKSGRKQRLGERVYGLLRLVDRLGRRTSRTIRLQHKEKRDREARYRGRVRERAFLFTAAVRSIARVEKSVVRYLRRRLAERLGLDTGKVRGKRRRR